MLRDPELLEALETIGIQPWSGIVYRVAWVGREPTQGSSGRSGRWSSPRGEFEILFTSLEQLGAEAEFEAFWMLFEQRPDRPASTHSLRVRLSKVIHLDYGMLENLGVAEENYEGRDYRRTQKIADAINFLEYDALISPSARYSCDNATIFFQNFSRGFELEPVESRDFAWSS
jgi:hypothetical protein